MNRYWKLLPALSLILIVSFVDSRNARGAARSPDYRSAVENITKFIRHELADKELPALSIALVDNQRALWSEGFGYSDPGNKLPATADTIYRVGSVSKLFTDVALMQLVEKGKLDLDAPVTKYLPEFRPHNPFAKEITLRELMSHRSGLVREPPTGNYFDPTGTTLRQTVISLNDTTLVYEPGSRTKYSNAAIAAAGYLLEATQHEPFASYVKRAVLDPLNMNHSSFLPSREITRHLAKGSMWTVDGRVFDAPAFQLGIAPAGSMYSTVQDLARFISFLLARGKTDRGQLLAPETIEQMWTPQFAGSGNKTGYGLGFRLFDLDGHRAVGHDGAIYGFSTTLSLLPEDKLGVAVVTTKDCANAVTDRIASYAMRAIIAARASKQLPEPDLTSTVDPNAARRVAGTYASGESRVELSNRNGSLFMLPLHGGYEVRLRSLGDSLIVDDRLSYGLRITIQPEGLDIGGTIYHRIEEKKPEPAPENYRGLIGEYGWDHDILYVLERGGKLWALIEWFEFDPLEQVSANVFQFPKRGLYDGEQLVFTRDAAGRAIQVIAAGVFFKRRAVGPEEGVQQLRVAPLKPVEELRKAALASHPPKEKGDFRSSDLVELTSIDPTIKLDIRYATTNNFLGSVFYTSAHAFMQRPAAEALARASKNLHSLGYGLLIHDAYRPWYVTKIFWDATPDDKKIFVADPSKGSRHNRGAAVDLTLYDLKTGKPIEMVGTYDETTDRSYPDYPGGTSLQRWHRKLLRDVMEAEGFTVYEAEWWHFDYKDWQKYPIGNQTFEQILTRTHAVSRCRERLLRGSEQQIAGVVSN